HPAGDRGVAGTPEGGAGELRRAGDGFRRPSRRPGRQRRGAHPLPLSRRAQREPAQHRASPAGGRSAAGGGVPQLAAARPLLPRPGRQEAGLEGGNAAARAGLRHAGAPGRAGADRVRGGPGDGAGDARAALHRGGQPHLGAVPQRQLPDVDRLPRDAGMDRSAAARAPGGTGRAGPPAGGAQGHRGLSVSPPFAARLRLEQAYLRDVLFAVELLDPVTLARVGEGIELVAHGLRGRPVRNGSGLFVWLKEDARLEKITIDPGRLPYESVELQPGELKPLPLPTTVVLAPRVDYAFAA